MSNAITANNREVIAVIDEITHRPFYVQGTSADGAINVNLTSGTIDIGMVDQGTGGASAWLTKIDQTGTNNQVQVANFPSTQSVTQGTSPWVVSGSVTTGGLTDTQLRATPVPISGTVTATASGTQDTNTKQVNGVTVNVGIGAAGTGTQRVSVSSDSFPATQAISGTIAATQSGAWNITNVSGTVSLPTGASTSALQTTGNASLSSIDTKLSGTLMVTDPAATTLVAFVTTVTTAGTRVQLASTVIEAGVLQAPSTNTGLIYVGGSNVSATVYGAELQPGQSTGIAIDNTNKLYIDSSVNGNKCAFFGSSV